MELRTLNELRHLQLTRLAVASVIDSASLDQFKEVQEGLVGFLENME